MVNNPGNVSLVDASKADKLLSKFDLFAIPVLALLAGVWMLSYVGTSIEWDDLLYMNVSQNVTAQPWILNRYVHIYMQKFFMFMAGSPLAGAKMFWVFLFCGTSVFTYWSAKILAGSRGAINGVVAVMFLFTHQLLIYYAGCTLCDFTAMFFMMAFVFLYLLSFSLNKKYVIWTILGLVLFCGIKSKEIAICLVPLCIAFGWDDEQQKFSLSQLARACAWLLLGVIAGSVVLMLLDLIFMGDGLFSIRPYNLSYVLGFNIKAPGGPSNRVSKSYFMYIFSKPLWVPFILYLLCGVRSCKSLRFHEKVLWLLPLVIIVFLNFIRGRFTVVPRYFLPAVPVICVWAAQFFNFDIKLKFTEAVSYKKFLNMAFVLVAALIVYVIVASVMGKMPDMAKFYYISASELYTLGILPLAICILLVSCVFTKRDTFLVLVLSVIGISLFSYYPLAGNWAIIKSKRTLTQSQWRYEPYRVFADKIEFEPDTKMFISENLHVRSWFLGRERSSQCWMFNIYFNQSFDYDQFLHGKTEDIFKWPFTHGFVTSEEWAKIKTLPGTKDWIKHYSVIPDSSIKVVLLKKK